MACSMLCTTDIEVYISPIFICLTAYERLVIVRIHITEIVGAAACKARHCAEFYRIALICPVSRSSERRFACLCRKELVNFRKLERKILKIHRSSHTVLEIHRERFSPISLTREYRIAETVVYLSASDAMLLHIIDGSRNRLLHGHSVEEA